MTTPTQPNSDREELHIMQLAAISTASLQNTPTSIKDRIDASSPYYSIAYSDVCAAIDREMVLLSERTTKDAEIQQLKASIAVKDEALRNLQSLVIEHHSYSIMREEHTICPACTSMKGDEVLNNASRAIHSTNPGAKLIEELTELRKDKERFDTAQKYCGNIDIYLINMPRGVMASGTWICTGQNLRTALDKLKLDLDAAISRKDENV